LTAEAENDVLAAALIQISSHAERISGLDTREAGHYQEIAERLRELAAEVGTLSTQIDGVGGTLAQQAAIITSLDGLDRQVAELAAQIAEFADEDGGEQKGTRYQPVPAPRWWKLAGPEREAALDRLRAWVDQIYLPGYGQLAAALPPCWEQHQLCLYMLDWLSELWSVLYLSSNRTSGTLAAQGEWQTRLLPAAADQMAHEAEGCTHSRSRRPHPMAPGTTYNGKRGRA
jgi:hypothetical protein